MNKLLLLVAVLTLSACGFHLRGVAKLPFETVYVEASGSPALGIALQRAIRFGSQTRPVAQPGEAEVLVHVISAAREKRILSLGGSGRVREYQLILRVSFSAQERAGRELLAPQQIELHRDFSYDDSQILAKESEEALLYDDMQNDAVTQILRRLSAIPPAGGK